MTAVSETVVPNSLATGVLAGELADQMEGLKGQSAGLPSLESSMHSRRVALSLFPAPPPDEAEEEEEALSPEKTRHASGGS